VPITLTSPDELDPADRSAVRALAGAVEAADGQPPLSDQALTRLASTEVRHVVAWDGTTLVGYAQLDEASLEIVGVTEALAPLLAAFAERRLLVWSHGKRSRLTPILTEHGFHPSRTLHQLRREAAAPADLAPVPEGVSIEAFVVGRDEDDWLRVNAASFAGHPEQGQWTRSDLEVREREPWFDPSGFLLAWRGEVLAGFHWTKIHPDALGEVYVIGVDPSAQGIGLGKVLLERGLAYLHSRDCPQVLLYVDDDNTTAMRLYERAGFRRYDLDVQWRSP
jgi:mycothiol synthase